MFAAHAHGDRSKATTGSARWMLDPLREDAGRPERTYRDVEVLRVVLAAIETGARFQREGIDLDPLAWMVTPRRMFHGRPPIEACIDAEACSRAVLVHGLGLGLDPDADAIDLLMLDDDLENLGAAA